MEFPRTCRKLWPSFAKLWRMSQKVDRPWSRRKALWSCTRISRDCLAPERRLRRTMRGNSCRAIFQRSCRPCRDRPRVPPIAPINGSLCKFVTDFPPISSDLVCSEFRVTLYFAKKVVYLPGNLFIIPWNMEGLSQSTFKRKNRRIYLWLGEIFVLKSTMLIYHSCTVGIILVTLENYNTRKLCNIIKH